MMKYLKKLPPHLIKESIELNEARTIFIEISRPLSQISQSIQTSANAVAEIKKEFETNKLLFKIENLDITQLDVKIDLLEYSRTVCIKCAETVFINGAPKTHYKINCHEKCECLTTNCGIINNADLQNCTAFSSGFCKVCQCSWNLHMHYGYQTQIVKTAFIDNKLQESLNEKMTYDEKQKILVNKLDSDIGNLEDQRKKLVEISAKLTMYIKKNSIIKFNDDFLKYLKLCIKEEENSNHSDTERASQLDILNSTMSMYSEQQNIFEKANQYINENDSFTMEFLNGTF